MARAAPRKERENPFRQFITELSPQAVAVEESEVVWEYIPPSLPEFITSKAFLGLPPLSARQLKAMTEGLEQDGVNLFSPENKYNELVLMWGKGSGKDYLASIVLAYFAYVILCLKNPHKFFNMAPGENLDIVNVATRQDQASDVFFSKLRARIESPCFTKFRPRPTRQKIEFPGKKLYIHSLHSKAEKWEGFNVVAWVMDEADAFQTADGHENADRVYRVLRSSAQTRFPDKRWVGVIISYPRSEIGFMFKHVKRQKASDGAYVDVAAHWEVSPFYDPAHPFYRNFEWVTVHDKFTIPKPFEQDFLNEPQSSAMAYMCVPPPVSGAFFEFPDLLEDCCEDRPTAAILAATVTYRQIKVQGLDESGEFVEGYEDRRFSAISLLRKAIEPEPAHYFIHGDPGDTKDSFGLCLAHTLPETARIDLLGRDLELNRVSVDLVIEWKPEFNQPVDQLNVRDVIIQLCNWYPVVQVTFDKFQSATVIQELLELEINAKSLSFSASQQLEMYRALKLLVYNKLVTWPRVSWPNLLEPQLRYLVQRGGRITHDESVSAKDVADAVAAACWYASGASMGRHGREILESIHGKVLDTTSFYGPQVGIVKRRLSA